MNRRQSIAVPQAGTNKENTLKSVKIKRAQSIGGPIDVRKNNLGADGLSPRRRKRRSMVSTLLLKFKQNTHSDEIGTAKVHSEDA